MAIVICQHDSTDTFWGQSAEGRCDPFVLADTRTTLHADQEIAIVGGFADGLAGGFASLAAQPGLWLLLVTLVACKAVLRMFR